jgi:hypothetical protein
MMTFLRCPSSGKRPLDAAAEKHRVAHRADADLPKQLRRRCRGYRIVRIATIGLREHQLDGLFAS